MREPGGAKHGIVRTIKPGHWIQEATYFEDKPHGLSFAWWDDNTFEAYIYDHGEEKACIRWNDDWSVWYMRGNKELILMNNGLNIFKP